MLRRIADRDRGEIGQYLYGSWALGKQVEQLKSLRSGGRLADAGDLLVDLVLEPALGSGHRASILVLARICNERELPSSAPRWGRCGFAPGPATAEANAALSG